MTTYTYYRTPKGKSLRVKHGFSWPAFFFGPIWALVKGAWRLFALLLMSFLLLVFIDERFAKTSGSIAVLLSMLVAYIAYMFVCGKNGNSWLRGLYEQRGYKRVSTDA
jgi:hypothetical protein